MTTISGDLCKGNGSTITATPTGNGPNTMNVNNMVLTSPSVYVGYSNIQYHSTGVNTTVNIRTSTTFAFDPDDVSMLCGPFDPSTVKLNLADLNWP